MSSEAGCWQEARTGALVLLGGSPCSAPRVLLTCLTDSGPHPAPPTTPHLSDSPGLWQRRRRTQLCPGMNRVKRGTELDLTAPPRSQPLTPSSFWKSLPPQHACVSGQGPPKPRPLLFSQHLCSAPQLTGSPPDANEIDCMWWLAMI